MQGLRDAMVGALVLGALNTLGDYLWARLVLPHRLVLGVAHGALLCLGLGLYLGLRRGRAFKGAAGGAVVGVLAALSFYAMAWALGYAAMFVSWMLLWIGFALLDARVLGAPWGDAESFARGGLAALASGLFFYLISGIWRRAPGDGLDYAYRFACWSFAFLPGFLALCLPRPRAR
jgi:hypothetical protein